jgi:hypothetical protein
MSPARFSIGIDLGTTNSALAYAPLNGDAPPEMLPIQQWETAHDGASSPLVPPASGIRNSGASTSTEVIGQIGTGTVAPNSAGDCNRTAGRGLLPNSLKPPATVTRSPRPSVCGSSAERSSPEVGTVLLGEALPEFEIVLPVGRADKGPLACECPPPRYM